MAEAAWGWVSAAAIGGVILFGFPFLLRGGGLLRRRGRGGDFRMRVGPSAPALIVAALLRRADTLLLIAASAAILVLIVINARA